MTPNWSRESAEDSARFCRRRRRMIRKPLDLPPAVARAFVEDMQAYFAETNQIKQGLIVDVSCSGQSGALSCQRPQMTIPPPNGDISMTASR
jgi:hypothetical protein